MSTQPVDLSVFFSDFSFLVNAVASCKINLQHLARLNVKYHRVHFKFCCHALFEKVSLLYLLKECCETFMQALTMIKGCKKVLNLFLLLWVCIRFAQAVTRQTVFSHNSCVIRMLSCLKLVSLSLVYSVAVRYKYGIDNIASIAL